MLAVIAKVNTLERKKVHQIVTVFYNTACINTETLTK